MTIYEVKQKTRKTAPYFFSRETMKYFRQTMKDFKVSKQEDGRFKIIAPIRISPKVDDDFTIRYFNPINNELEIK